jgi:hypothetical protein
LDFVVGCRTVHALDELVVEALDVRGCDLKRMLAARPFIERADAAQVAAIGVRAQAGALQEDSFDVLEALHGLEDPLRFPQPFGQAGECFLEIGSQNEIRCHDSSL